MSVSPAFTPPGSPDREHDVLIQQARIACLMKRRVQDNSLKYFTYVLELQEGCYYVGRTLNIYQRLMTHLFDWEDNGVEWIKLCGPVKRVVEIFSECSKEEETTLTLLWMHRLGWERVRGGPWTKRILKHKPRDVDKQNVHDLHCSTTKSHYMSRPEIDTILKTISSIQNDHQ